MKKFQILQKLKLAIVVWPKGISFTVLEQLGLPSNKNSGHIHIGNSVGFLDTEKGIISLKGTTQQNPNFYSASEVVDNQIYTVQGETINGGKLLQDIKNGVSAELFNYLRPYEENTTTLNKDVFLSVLTWTLKKEV